MVLAVASGSLQKMPCTGFRRCRVTSRGPTCRNFDRSLRISRHNEFEFVRGFARNALRNEDCWYAIQGETVRSPRMHASFFVLWFVSGSV